MLTRDTLIAASRQGLIGLDQVDPLLAFLTGEDQAGRAVMHDPEEMHFARGFHDIFISIGLVILMSGYFATAMLFGNDGATTVLMTYGGGMVLVWGLAEWFSKALRLSLPSILLSGLFVALSGLTGVSLLSVLFALGNGWSLPDWAALDGSGFFGLVPFVAAIVGGLAFYGRFRVPITPTFITLATIGLFFMLLALIEETLLTDFITLWMMLVGVGCLALALWYDRQDRLRQTVKSDTAFWLHLVAAPLLVHSLLSHLSVIDSSAFAALATIALFVLIGLFALIIDRRALLASGIGYLGVAIGILIKQSQLGEGGAVALTLLILGLFVLMLGSAWTKLRDLLLSRFSHHPLMRSLPPVSSERI